MIKGPRTKDKLVRFTAFLETRLLTQKATLVWKIFSLILLVLGTVALFLNLGFKAQAATFSSSYNPEINYQGKLTNASNVAVPDGTYQIVYSLYTTSIGGAAVWTEPQTVTVTNGLFSVLLGSVTPLSTVDFNQTLYLGVKIGTDSEMTPRKQLGAVPAAFEADRLNGLHSSQFVRTDTASTIASSSAGTLLTVNQTGSGSILDVQSNGVTSFSILNDGTASTTNLFVTNRVTAAYASTTVLSAGTICLTGDVCRTTWPSASGSGTGSFWATSTNSLIGYPDLSTGFAIVIGDNATTSNSKFEVLGNTKLRGELLVTGSTSLQNFTGLNSTTTNATSTSLFASILQATTGFFTNLVATNATTTNLAVTGSSTINLLNNTYLNGVYASTTALTVNGPAYLLGDVSIGGNATTSGTLVVGTTQPTIDLGVGDIWAGGSLYFSASSTVSGTDSDLVFSDSTAGVKTLSQLLIGPAGCTNVNRLISGGVVTYNGSGLTFDISPAAYCINGLQYSSPASQVTLSTADSTFDRIDLIVLNTSSTAVAIAGSASANPIAPSASPLTQLALTFISVPAGATAPVNFIQEVLYRENIEWVGSETTPHGAISFTASSDPQQGTKNIESTTALGAGDYFDLATSTWNPTNYQTLSFYIKNKANWPNTAKMNLTLRNSSNVQVGSTVILQNGAYGFVRTNTSSYQKIAIPLSDFGVIGTAVKYLRFTAAPVGNNTINFRIDNIVAQGSFVGNNAPSSGLSGTGPLGALSFWTSSSTLAGDSRLQWATTSGKLTVPYASTTALTVTGNSYLGTASSTALTISNMTSGSVLFAGTGGVVSQNNTSFNWNDSATRLTLPYASTTALTISADTGLSIGSLNGPLQAINGLVSATSTLSVAYGGTGTSTFDNGGIVFGDGTKLTQDTTNFFWDNTTKHLGIGGTTTPMEALTVSGNILVSQDAAPTYVGLTSVSSSPQGVFVSGHYAYVVNTGSNALAIFDVSNPSNIVAKGTTDTNLSGASWVFVSGKYAYVTSEDNTFAIFDISDPNNIVAKGSTNTNLSQPQAVFVSGHYAYIADLSNNSLAIFDISNPNSIVAKGTITTNLSGPRNVFVSGNYAYVASTGNGKLAIFDISDPNSIVAKGTITTNLSTPFKVFVSGKYAYVADVDTGLSIFDVSNPSSIVAKGNSPASIYSVFVSDNYAYAGSSGVGLSVYDVSDPNNIVLKGSNGTNVTTPNALYVSGNYAYVGSSGNNKLVAFQLANTKTPTLAAGSATIGNLQVYDNSQFNGDLTVGNNFIIGKDAFIQGNLAAPYASTTALTVSGVRGLSLGSLNGPLQAINGQVSATSSIGVVYGGTGLSTAPSYGQLLLGNSLGGYTLTATSSLGLLGSSTVSNLGNNYLSKWSSTTNSLVNSQVQDDGTTVNVSNDLYVKDLTSTIGTNWTARTSAGSATWQGVSISSTGQYQTAVGQNTKIYISSDYGATWTAKGTTQTWEAVAVSSTGQYQTAGGQSTQLYVSSDFGATWTAKESSRQWWGVSISSTGQYQTAVAHSGQIYVSSDFGATWTAKDSSRTWGGVSVSSTGQYQTAVVGYWALSTAGQIYVSSDFGATWTAKASSLVWSGVSISSNGQYQTAVASSNQIYVSSDFGATWTAKESSRSWIGVSISSTGQYQTALTRSSMFIYGSSDYGSTWSLKNTGSSQYFGISISSTGQYQTAVSTDYIYTSGLSALIAVGIGTSTPTSALTVDGTITLANSAQLIGDTSYLRSTTGLAFGANQTYNFNSAGVGNIAGLNVSTSSSPTAILTGSVTQVATSTTSSPRNIAVCGNYGYAVNQGQSNLAVIDLNTKSLPTILAATTTNISTPYGVACDGSYVYVANFGSGKLTIYDVTTPSLPTYKGQVTLTGGSAQDIVVSGNYAYISGSGMSVVDITSKTAPVEVGVLNTSSLGSSCRGITKSGNYVYITCEGAGYRDGAGGSSQTDGQFSVVDVSTPASPSRVAFTRGASVIGDARDVVVLGTHAYVTSLTGYLTVYDISTPSTISTTTSFALDTTTDTVGQSNTPGWIYPLTMNYGNFVVVNNISLGKTQIVNVTTPASPTIYETISTGLTGDSALQPWGVYADSSYLYLSRSNQTSNGTFDIYSLQSIFAPNLVTVAGQSTLADIIPSVTDIYSIGSSALRYLNGYFKNLYADTLQVTSGTFTNATSTNLAISGITNGSVLFAGTGGLISQNNSNFFWDNTSNRLGLGTNSPTATLDIVGNAKVESSDVTFGTPVSFSHSDNGGEEDDIDDTVHLSRGTSQALYNTVTESEWNSGVSPANTEWNVDGFSDLSNIQTRTYGDMKSVLQNAFGSLQNVVGQEVLMHIISNDTYYEMVFSQWTCCGGGGGFAYTRTQIFPGGNLTAGSLTSGSKLTVGGVSYLAGHVGIGTTNPTINLAIGDNDTGFNSIGDGNLVAYANGSQKVWFNNNGLGIGASPSYPLTVTGSEVIQGSGGLSFGGAQGSNSDNQGLWWWDIGNVAWGRVSRESATGNLLIDSQTNKNIILNGSNTSSEVGISTSSPFTKLQINGTSNAAIGTKAMLSLSDSTAAANLKHWTISSQGGNLYIATSSDALATSTIAAITINKNGYLGIGSTTPANALSVTGKAYIDQNVVTNGTVASIFPYASTTALSVSTTASTTNLFVSNKETSLFASSTSLSVTGSSYFAATAGTKVGIGTTTPSGNLDIYDNTGNGSILNIDAMGSGAGQAILRIKAGVSGTNRAAAIQFFNGATSPTAARWGFFSDFNQDGTNDFRLVNAANTAIITALQNGNVTIPYASSTYFTTSNLLAIGSTTLQNFTAVNSTTTAATTTNLYVSSSAMLAVTGGRVGIGTAAPADELHVTQSSNSAVGAIIENTSSGSSAYTYLQIGNNTDRTAGIVRMSGNNSGYCGANCVNLYNQGAFPVGITTNNLIRLTVGAGGNVGIGTIAPIGLLQISGTRASTTLSDTSAASGFQNWGLSSQGGNFYLATSTDTGATSTIAAITINKNGYLGIGTTSPGSALSVSGSGYINGVLSISQSGTNAVIMGDTSGNTRGTYAVDIQSGRSAASSVASGNFASAIGYDNTASNLQSSAFGYGNTAPGYESSAFGYINTTSGVGSSAFGFGNTASGDDSSTAGTENAVSALRSYAFGFGITNNIANSLMVGPSNNAKLTIRDTGYLGIGTTTPLSLLTVSGTRASTTISDSSAGTNFKNWSISSQGGNFYIATSTDLGATSTISALALTKNGNLGIGQNPNEKLSVAGNIGLAGYSWSVTTSGDTNWGYTMNHADGSGDYWVQPKFYGSDTQRGFRVFDTYNSIYPFSTNAYETIINSSRATFTSDVRVNGSLDASVLYYRDGLCNGDIDSGCYDLAELYPTTDNTLAPGEIVMPDTASSTAVKRADPANLSAVLGIVSSAPSILINGSGGQLGSVASTTYVGQTKIALAGRVPVKVSTEAGAIHAGDRIALSSLPGIGMKATTSSFVVGVALGDFDGTSNATDATVGNTNVRVGKVMIYVDLSYAHIDPVLKNGTIVKGDLWTVDLDTGNLKPFAALDMSNMDINNVKAITSASGNWSIDNDGILTVKEIHADKLCLGQTCVTETQLQQLLNQNSLMAAPGGSGTGGGDTGGGSGDPTSTPPTDPGSGGGDSTPPPSGDSGDGSTTPPDGASSDIPPSGGTSDTPPPPTDNSTPTPTP